MFPRPRALQKCIVLCVSELLTFEVIAILRHAKKIFLPIPAYRPRDVTKLQI